MMLPIPSDALPNAIYREEFFKAVMAERPSSILDIGCGDGAFLKAIAARGCRAHGLDTDPAAIERLHAEGVAADTGRAEALPFADRSFELVAFSYTTHHLADLPRALNEALRVARKAVLVL